MRLVEYSAAHAQALARALARSSMEAPLLREQAFLDHYFGGRGRARLNLMMSEDGEVCATLGSERLHVEIEGATVEISVLSSPFGFTAGAFPFLMMQWMRTCDIGVVFPGNALLRDMVAGQGRWASVSGLRVHWLNWGYPCLPGDSYLKRLVKPLLRRWTLIDASKFGAKIRASTMNRLSISEVAEVDEEMVRCKGSFSFRLAETPDYFNWRFDTRLQYVQYRIFKILDQGAVSGFVVLADWQKCVVVAHCDGNNAEDVALSVLIAIAQVNQGCDRHRKVLLSCMHEDMQRIFQSHGFQPEPKDQAFYIAYFKGVPQPATYPKGLMNLDFWDGGAHLGLFHRP